MEPIKTELGFSAMLAVSCDCCRGGLALLWKVDEVTIDTHTYSPNHIAVRVHTYDSLWRLIGIYEHLEEELKGETWRLMRHLHARASLPWVRLGDFNEILSSNEKNGGNLRPMGAMMGFRQTLLHCGLVDLGFNGYRFTWRNGWVGSAFVEERLAEEYFHQRVSQRRRKNNIVRLYDRDGMWQTDEDKIANISKEYYKQLYTSSNSRDVGDMIELVDRVAMEGMAQSLTCTYIELGFSAMLAMSCDSCMEWLALLWKVDEVTIDTQTYSPNHIDVRVHTYDSLWRLTRIYEHLEEELKGETWRLMRYLHARASLPWVRLGDFNEILSSNEKNGGNLRPMGAMMGFWQTLLHCGLVDLGFNGYRFTWRNGRVGLAFVEERLDKVVATSEWREMFPRTKVRHIPVSYSDHYAILMDMDPPTQPKQRRHKFQQFEEKWVTYTDCETIIRDSWNQTQP